MEWWQKLVFPLRRVCCSVFARLRPHHKNGRGLVKLHDDIQTCGYEDVQIMWEMLSRTQSQVMMKPKKGRWFWTNPSPQIHLRTSPQLNVT